MSVILDYFNDIETIKKDPKEIEKYLIQLFNTINPEKNLKILCDYHEFYIKNRFDSIHNISYLINELLSNKKQILKDFVKIVNKKFKKIINEFSKQLAKHDDITFETIIKIGKKEVKVHHVIIALLSLNIFYKDDSRDLFFRSFDNSFLTVKSFFKDLAPIAGFGFFFYKYDSDAFNQDDFVYLDYKFIINQCEVICKDSFIHKINNYELLSHEIAHSLKIDFTKDIQQLDKKIRDACDLALKNTIFNNNELHKKIKALINTDEIDSIEKIIDNQEKINKEINNLKLQPIDAQLIINFFTRIANIKEKILYFTQVFTEWPAIIFSFLFIYTKAIASTNDNFKLIFLYDKNTPLTKLYQSFLKKFHSTEYRIYGNTNIDFLSWLQKTPNQPLEEIIQKIKHSLKSQVLTQDFILIIEQFTDLAIREHLIKSMPEKKYKEKLQRLLNELKTLR